MCGMSEVCPCVLSSRAVIKIFISLSLRPRYFPLHPYVRLKIKCDKKLPCSSCLRRGCAALCPNGELFWPVMCAGCGAIMRFFVRFRKSVYWTGYSVSFGLGSSYVCVLS